MKDDIEFTPLQRLIFTAKAILGGNMNLLEGIRTINSLRFQIGEADSDVFIVIRSIDSETDHFPLGEARDKFNQSYLNKLDDDLKLYFDDARDDIFAACREIIKKYSL